LLPDPFAKYAPPPGAMVRTTMDAVLIRFIIHIYADTLELHVVAALLKKKYAAKV
jgi:hypothetical protein